MSPTIDRADVLAKFQAMARGASDLIMKVYAGEDLGAELKGPNDPVTRADKEANAYLLGELAKHLPGIPVVAEESDPSQFKGFEASPIAIFVDPVDGTREFIARNGEFCVMIGLAEEGRATVGVVLCPTYKEQFLLFGGAEGIGAFVIDGEGKQSPIRVSAEMDLAKTRCAVSRFHRSKSVDAKLATLGFAEMVPIGSSGIKGIEVARGGVELYCHPSHGKVKLWDACAPDAIVRAAGGVLTDSHGKAFDYRGEVAQGEGTVGGNETLHAEAIKRFEAYEAANRTTRR